MLISFAAAEVDPHGTVIVSIADLAEKQSGGQRFWLAAASLDLHNLRRSITTAPIKYSFLKVAKM